MNNPWLWLEVVLPDDRKSVELGFAQLFQGKTVTDECRIIRRDGTTHWIEAKVIPVFDKSGNLLRVDGVITDVTRKKRSHETLRQSVEKYKNLINWSPIGVYNSTLEGKFLVVNPGLVNMLGYNSEEELLGLHMDTDVYNEPEAR